MMFFAAALLPMSALSAQVAAAPRAIDFSTSPAVPGAWSYRSVPGMSEAVFMDTTGRAQLSISCRRANRHVVISRTSAVPASSLFVWTSNAQRPIAASFDPRLMRVSAALNANDRLLDAIAFSRGRFAVTIPGAVPLVVAPSPEAARVFEDCRI